MQQRFEEHINQNFGFLKTKKLLVACSGGVDSVVLAHLLKNTSLSIAIAHCNFLLRGEESHADEAFVKQLADTLKCPFYCEQFDTHSFARNEKVSIQMAARALRYQWFFELLKANAYDFLVTAHHLDDDFETFLINTIRTTGLRGLIGIPSHTEKIVRPLLPFTKEDIKNYALAHDIDWREDSSNQKTDYLRNKLRIDVVPKLKEIEPQLLQNFANTQKYLSDSHQLLDDYIGLVYRKVVTETNDGYSISITKLRKFPSTKALLYKLLHPFGFTVWQDICDLMDTQTGKKIISDTHILLKNRTELLLRKNESVDNEKEYLISEKEEKVDIPIKLKFELFKKEQLLTPTTQDKNIIFVDKKKVNYPLHVRKWRRGDVFYPYGLEGKKKISKFFKDKKLSLFDKNNVWLLCSGSKVLWILGYTADRRFKITKETTSILKITHNE